MSEKVLVAGVGMIPFSVAEGSEGYWNRVIGEALLGQPRQTVLDFVKEQVR